MNIIQCYVDTLVHIDIVQVKTGIKWALYLYIVFLFWLEISRSYINTCIISTYPLIGHQTPLKTFNKEKTSS
jgi:hypothetical protein